MCVLLYNVWRCALLAGLSHSSPHPTLYKSHNVYQNTDGKCVVIGLQSTGEATAKQELSMVCTYARASSSVQFTPTGTHPHKPTFISTHFDPSTIVIQHNTNTPQTFGQAPGGDPDDDATSELSATGRPKRKAAKVTK